MHTQTLHQEEEVHAPKVRKQLRDPVKASLPSSRCVHADHSSSKVEEHVDTPPMRLVKTLGVPKLRPPRM